MPSIRKTFLTGLITAAPLTVTGYIIWLLCVNAQKLIDPLVVNLIPHPANKWPLIGIAVAIVFVFLIGLLMNFWLVRWTFGIAERILTHVPLVKTLYGSLKDLMSFFKESDKAGKRSGRPVVVRLTDSVRLVGLMTRDQFDGLPKQLGDEQTVAVYVPMSYQIGGFTTMVPRSSIESLEMSTEDVMRFAMTAAMSTVESKRAPDQGKTHNLSS